MKNIHVNPDPCIACTTCTVFCPVAAQTTEFLGPRMIGPAYERFRLLGLVEDKSLSYCANCKNCDISCPQGVQIAAINMLARARQMEHSHPHFLRDWIVSHNETLGHLIALVPAKLKNWSMKNPLVRFVLDGIGIDRRVTMPTYSEKLFRKALKGIKQPKGKKVALFPGCYIDLFDDRTGFDLVWALNKAGYEVEIPPEFSCCGVPMIASGFMEDARSNAVRNIAVLRRYAKEGIPVLTGCPSCELMFREEIPSFFPELTAEGEQLSLMDAQEFLLECAKNGSFHPELKESSETLLYHAPCHLRALGIGLPGLELLRELGVDIRAANAGCCGISGSYGFKKEKHEVAMKVGSGLFEAVKDSRATTVATECGTCRLQIESNTMVPTLHPVSILRSFAQE